MKKYILPILIFIGTFSLILLMHLHIIPDGAGRVIVSGSLLLGVVIKRIYDKTFCKVHFIMLCIGAIFCIILTIA